MAKSVRAKNKGEGRVRGIVRVKWWKGENYY